MSKISSIQDSKKKYKSERKRKILRKSRSKKVSNSFLTSDSCPQSIVLKKSREGRRLTQFYEKLRIQELKKPSRVLASYFCQYSFNLMGIYNVTSRKLQRQGRKRPLSLRPVTHEDISEALEGNKWLFLKILNLMIKDHTLSIEEMLKTDFSQKLLLENVPGSLIFGFSELRKAESVSQGVQILKLKPVDIKSFYIISLILFGVSERHQIFDQIDYPIELLSIEDAIDEIFEKIVTKLLTETSLLKPILFEELQKKWDIIIETISLQFSKQSQKKVEIKKYMPVLLNVPSTPEHLRKILGKATESEEKIVQKQIKEFIEREKEKKSAEKQQFWNTNLPKVTDFFDVCNQFFFDSGPLFEETEEVQEKIQQRKKSDKIVPKKRSIRFKSSREDQDEEKGEKISKDLAIKRFNFEQKRKRDRSGTRNKLSMINQSYVTDETPEMSKATFQQESSLFSLGGICVEESTQNKPEVIRKQIREIQSEIKISAIQQPQEAIFASKQNKSHQKREVDDLIRELMGQQMAIAMSIANHIYHSMVASGIELDEERN